MMQQIKWRIMACEMVEAGQMGVPGRTAECAREELVVYQARRGGGKHGGGKAVGHSVSRVSGSSLT
jgi:hypothetical protein